MPSNNLIQKDFKIRFVISFCLIVFIGAVISGIGIYIATYKDIGNIYSQAVSALRNTKTLLAYTILITIIFQTAIMSIIIAAVTLFVSHKIVGPVYRLGNSLKNINASGDLTSSIRFRTTDPTQQLADIFNFMTTSLCQRMKKIEQCLSRIKDIETQMDEIAAEDSIDRDKLEAVKNSLECEIAEIKNVLAEFKIN